MRFSGFRAMAFTERLGFRKGKQIFRKVNKFQEGKQIKKYVNKSKVVNNDNKF